MLRDLRIFRRNSGNNENTPVDPLDSSAPQLESNSSRAPLNTIQESTVRPKPGLDQGAILRRKTETTPSRNHAKGESDGHLPVRTPEKPSAARNRFGWVPKSEPQPSFMENGDELSHLGPSQLPLPGRGANLGIGGGYGTNTPRANRTAGKASSVHSDCSSTQSTPTKSVTKPTHSGFSSSRPPTGAGARAKSFSIVSKGIPTSASPPTVLNSAEVPHFELREDPSFWMDHNVQVVIRVRPLNSTERSLQGYNRCVKQESAQCITWIGQPEARFTFDYIACETVNQEVLFRVAGLPMVENCMSGYNSCMFAYGQTGSGKTYTMLGEIGDLEARPSPDRGMTPRIFEFLFARIRAEEESRRDEKLKYNCKCSFLEIYNEQITDLLDPSSNNLLLREDTRKGVYVENLSEFEVENVSDILKLLIQGAANRKVAATNMNRESSRSHSVFTCIIQSRWEKDSTTNLRFARLNLVDLAGSERQKTSGAEGERLKEAANINKSLSTLGHVIMVLADVAHGKQRHVPYRDSRLTFLLQDSLGGNSKTMIIANVSPSICSSNETLSTLKFAQRARLIQNNAVVNEDSSGDIVALQHQIHLLKEELIVLKRQKVSRSLSFRTAIFEDREGEVRDTPAMEEFPGVDQVNANGLCNNEASLGTRVSSRQLRSLETTLAGALRREKMADTTIRQLEAEVEQLNRLVRQREEDTQCTKMTLKFREDKIHRMEKLLDGLLPSDSYLLEENKGLFEEIQLLRARVDRNPEVTRFALENIRLLDQLRRFQEFYEEGERELLLNEVSELRNQLIEILDGKSEQDQHPKSDTESQDLGHPQFASSIKENEHLSIELKKTNQELENCRHNLKSCLELNERLTREISDLHLELNSMKSPSHAQDINVRSQTMELCSKSSQEGFQVCAKTAECLHENTVRHAEEILNLQLELDILKMILREEKSSRLGIEETTIHANNELQIANGKVLQISQQYEDIKKELKEARSVIEALESEHIFLINELEELRANNSQRAGILNKQEQEIITLRKQLGIHIRREERQSVAHEEIKDRALKNYNNEDSPLQLKLKRMQASLEKALILNMRSQNDQASQTSLEQEMDEVRRQVEVETAEVIVCLQEELIALQQRVDDSNRSELMTKQSLMVLETEMKQLQERLCLVTQENETLSQLFEETDRDLRSLTEDWDRLAYEIADVLADGNTALDKASDHVACISESFPQKSWISEQVGGLIRSLSERDILIEELQKCLEDAQNARSDMEWKLRSLRGAALAVTEAQQQESSDREKEILLLTSQLFEKTSAINELENNIKLHEEQIRKAEVCATVAFMTVNRLSEINTAQLQELDHVKLLLNESKEMILQKDALRRHQVSLDSEAEKQIQALNSQLQHSQEYIAKLVKQAQEQEQAQDIEQQKKKEEDEALSRIAGDLLEAKSTLNEFKLGVRALHSCMSDCHKQADCPAGLQSLHNTENSSVERADNNHEDRTDTISTQDVIDNEQHIFERVPGGSTKSSAGENANDSKCKKLSEYTSDRESTFCFLRKETVSTLNCLKELRNQMVKVLEEKEMIKNSQIQGWKSIEHVVAEVLQLKSEIIDKEKHFEIRLKEMEDKLQTLEGNVTTSNACWCKAKEAFEIEISEAKAIAMQKTTEASNLLTKIEEAQETIKDADIMVNALLQANETAKLDIERHQKIESALTYERDSLMGEAQHMQSSLYMREQEYKFMENSYWLNLTEARNLVMELEDSFRHLQTTFTEEFKFLSCDLDWLKSQLQQNIASARSWLEETWSEIIGKDCSVSVLHLCHMGIFLERITGLHVENSFLHHGLCESTSVIADLRAHNVKAKKELEMCSILKGKLLVDINNSFNRIAKKEAETDEFTARLNSFEKKILHLQLQEESMLARSNSMGSELAILVKDLDANHRNSLTTVSICEKLSREKEQLKTQLKGIKEMFRDSLTEELSLLVDDSQPEFQLHVCALKDSNLGFFRQCEQYKDLITYRTDSVMINMMAKDIELLVLASEMEQNLKGVDQMSSQIADLEKQRESINGVIEKIEMEVIIGKIEADLERSEMHYLLAENGKLKNDLLKLKEEHFRTTTDLQETKTGFASSLTHVNVINQDNQKLQEKICSLEACIASLQTKIHKRNAELEELLHTHTIVSRELELKTEISEIQLERTQALKLENDSLKNDVVAFVKKKDEAITMLDFRLKQCLDLVQSIDMVVDRIFRCMDGQIVLMMDKVHQDNFEHKELTSKFFDDVDILELSVKKIMCEYSSLESNLKRKDEVSKGLLFDLSLLQEKASVAKDQTDELEEMAVTLKALEEELASKSCELDEAVARGQMLEAELLEKNEKISALELELDENLDKLNSVSTENLKLKVHIEHIIEMKNTIEEELTEKARVTESLEKEILEMSTLLGQRTRVLEDLQNKITKLTDEREHLDTEVLVLKDKLEMAEALCEENEAIATEARQVAEGRKNYAEEKEEEVRLLEKSVEELECTIYALENKVDIVREEAERQRLHREELETELQTVRCQVLSVPASGDLWNVSEGDNDDFSRCLKEKMTELNKAQQMIRDLQKEVAEKDSEIVQCKAHISELNMHAEAQARECKQKIKELEAMAQQVKVDSASFNSSSSTAMKSEKSAAKPRGSGSPFKCIGLGLVQQINSEKDEDLTAARRQIEELEVLAASRQREIFTLNTRLAAAESMTHDVIRDLLGVKLDMTNYASLLDCHQTPKLKETACLQSHESQQKDELVKLKKQLNQFIEERQSWLDEINQRHTELVAARLAAEKFRQHDQFLSTENEVLKADNANYKKRIMELEDKMKKLSNEQNLQQRIHHHAKIKEENHLLKIQNTDLNTKLQQSEVVLSRVKEDLAHYRASIGRDPYVNIDKEERLKKKLQDSEEDRVHLSQKLTNLCNCILKVAGLAQSASPNLLEAEDALGRLKDRINSLENEVQDLKLKCKIFCEKIRLSDIGKQSSLHTMNTMENYLSPRTSVSPRVYSP